MPLALTEFCLSAALLLVNAAAVGAPVILTGLLIRFLCGLRRGERGFFRRGRVRALAAAAAVLALGVWAFYAPRPLVEEDYDFSALSYSAGGSDRAEASSAQQKQVQELLSRYRCRRMGTRVPAYGMDGSSLELTAWDAGRRESVRFVLREDGCFRYTAVNTGFCYAVLDPDRTLPAQMRALLGKDGG